MAAKYRWIITKDHLDETSLEVPPLIKSRVGVQGPHDLDPNVKSNPVHFSMYDDDGECYYEGMLYGDYDGFEPLDDFGRGDAGCTSIKVNGEFL